MRYARGLSVALLGCVVAGLASEPGRAQTRQDSLDARVRRFLEANRYRWRDLNVPFSDGQILYDLVLRHGFARALEIGTSTGHSAIWIAWALSRTGGRLVTIEIDEGRYREALRNFREAGVADHIDARLADAHELVPALAGPFDFVFADADKDWNTRYFELLLPKLAAGGCYTVHNVSRRRWGWVSEFLSAVERVPNLETRIVGTGISVSCKRPAGD